MPKLRGFFSIKGFCSFFLVCLVVGALGIVKIGTLCQKTVRLLRAESASGDLSRDVLNLFLNRVKYISIVVSCIYEVVGSWNGSLERQGEIDYQMLIHYKPLRINRWI